MTNEELVIAIQDGAQWRMEELYNAVVRFIHQQATKRLAAYNAPPASVDVEDLEQQAYFAVLDAVAAYDRNKEHKFITYLSYHLKNAFNAVLGKCKFELSLDAPAYSDDEETTIGDTIPDGRDYIAGVDEGIFTSQLAGMLSEMLSTIPGEQAETLRCRYYEEKTQQETADVLGTTRDKVMSIEKKALRTLGTGKNRMLLEEYRDEVPRFKVGLHEFMTTHTSEAEKTLLFKERHHLL